MELEQKDDEKKHAKCLIAIIVLGVLLLGAIGYIVCEKTIWKKECETCKVVEGEQTVDPGYLTVREWGVRFRIPQGVTGATYEFMNWTDSTATHNRLVLTDGFLSSHSFPEDCQSVPNVSINRFEDTSFEGGFGIGQLIATIDGLYYYASINWMGCFGNDDSLEIEAIGRIMAMAETIEKI